MRFTRADCEKMEAVGLLPFRYELMDGVILRKPPRYPREAVVVSQTSSFLGNHFAPDFVLPGCGIIVAPGENDVTFPVPDVTILNKSGLTIPGDYPRPEDISLLIEVSDTTLDYDLTTKAGVYSRAGIEQYLVIDINARVVYDHRLTPGGAYRRETRRPGDAIVLASAAQLLLRVDDLLLSQTA